jgi:hypothetical protein
MSENSTDKLPDSQENTNRILTAIESLGRRLDNLEEIVDQRLRATQPIWEAMQNDLAEVKKDLAALRADTEKGFRTIDRRMEKQIGEFERLHAYQRDLEDRVDRIEKLSST